MCPVFGALLPLVGAMLAFIATFLFYKLAGNEQLRPKDTFRILLTHYQVSALHIAFKLKYPEIFLQVMSWIYNIITFNIGGTWIAAHRGARGAVQLLPLPRPVR